MLRSPRNMLLLLSLAGCGASPFNMQGDVCIKGTGPGGFVPEWGGPAQVVGDVCIDATEVTVADYQRCVENGVCVPATTMLPVRGGWEEEEKECNGNRRDRQGNPVNCVNWDQARVYCDAQGKRLPTEWEWEWAARGREEGRAYPWGYVEPSCKLAVVHAGRNGCGKDWTWPVGSKPGGDSRDGIKDMAGNVFEWTGSLDGEDRTMVRGGHSSDGTEPDGLRVGLRWSLDSAALNYRTGFRCARTAPAD